MTFSKKNILGKKLNNQTVWTKIRLPVSSILIRVQTVYKRLSPDDTDRPIVKQKLIIIARVVFVSLSTGIMTVMSTTTVLPAKSDSNVMFS